MLKEAVVISILIHSAILLPLSYKDIRLRISHPRDSIVVEYAGYRASERRTGKAPDPNTRPGVEIKTAVASRSANSLAAPAKRPLLSAKEAARALAVKQAKIMSTKEYASYYQLIRERIKRKMGEKYRSYHGQGNVYLAFVLHADGSLESSTVNPALSTPDQTLVNMAIQSLREAAPFPPFPKVFTLPQMSFTLPVSFKRR